MDNKILWPGWETVRLIGRGSYGAVYEIERELYEGEKQKAALKVISIPHEESEVKALRTDGLDDKSITRVFESQSKEVIKEYALMSKLSGHTNIVDCHEFRHVQQEDGLGWDVFIRMELLRPFDQELGGTIEEEQVIAVGKDLCRALTLCRKYNIVHRDIKPQNIFVSDTGDYKLGDFGIARTMERTSGATSIGTLNYMAPEVSKGLDYGHRADIYSLGLVLYWMINERRLPFFPLPPKLPTHTEKEVALKRRLNGETIPAPKNGSEALKAIVLKACAYKPEDRYATADEMLKALNALDAAGEDTIIKKDTSENDTVIKKKARKESTKKETDSKKAENGGKEQPRDNKNPIILALIALLAVAVVLAIPKGDKKTVSQENTPAPAVTVYVQVPAPTPAQMPQPTPVLTPTPMPAPTPTPTPVVQSAPSVKDLEPFGDEITYPNRASYLSGYETMYVKSEKGYGVYVYWTSSAKSDFRRKYVLLEADEVTVLARENDMSCVVFTASNGETHVGWVTSTNLVYEYS